MDKTSVLSDAIKYMEYLQQRVRILEEQAANQAMDSEIFVEDEEYAGGDNSNSDEQILPEIKVRICNKTILLKIQCGKRKGLLVKILGELEKLNLPVANISVAPFGSLVLDITIISKV